MVVDHYQQYFCNTHEITRDHDSVQCWQVCLQKMANTRQFLKKFPRETINFALQYQCITKQSLMLTLINVYSWNTITFKRHVGGINNKWHVWIDWLIEYAATIVFVLLCRARMWKHAIGWNDWVRWNIKMIELKRCWGFNCCEVGVTGLFCCFGQGVIVINQR